MDEIININGHTKSPWTLERDGDDYDSILELRGDSGSKPIACLYDSFFSDEHELTPEEVEADGLEYKRNIVLIQHAPELLEAGNLLFDSLTAWMEIASKEDEREYDKEAIRKWMNVLQATNPATL